MLVKLVGLVAELGASGVRRCKIFPKLAWLIPIDAIMAEIAFFSSNR